jgi:hypothetical protein
MVKQYPGVFDYKKQRGESKDNFESRMKETGGKANEALERAASPEQQATTLIHCTHPWYYCQWPQ